MQLEKASSASQEAGVVGWISSNDVTLFAVVLMLVVAIFLQASLERRNGENEALHLEKEGLTQAGVRKDAHVAELAARLDRAVQEAARLEAARSRLKDERDSLTRELQSTGEQLAAVQGELGRLVEAKAALARSKQTELAARDEQLAARAAELAGLREERGMLETSLASLRGQVASVEAELTAADRRLVTANQEKRQLDETAALLRKALAQSEQKLAATAEQVASAAEEQKLMDAQVAALQNQLREALDRADQARSQLETRRLEDKGLHRKLAGVSGPLKRVAVLVDASGSMAEAPGRWEGVRQIVADWLEHLDVEQCVLILFSSEVESLPDDGSLLVVRGPAGEQNRGRLAERLARHQPGGWTNTLGALEAAYAHDQIDTIILFTDGKPASPGAQFDRAAIERIHELSAEHRDIPVNTIGVGDYFADPEISVFLRKLADTTGGTFLGR